MILLSYASISGIKWQYGKWVYLGNINFLGISSNEFWHHWFTWKLEAYECSVMMIEAIDTLHLWLYNSLLECVTWMQQFMLFAMSAGSCVKSLHSISCVESTVFDLMTCFYRLNNNENEENIVLVSIAQIFNYLMIRFFIHVSFSNVYFVLLYGVMLNVLLKLNHATVTAYVNFIILWEEPSIYDSR